MTMDRADSVRTATALLERALATPIAPGTPAAELSQDQIFALAVAAGAPYHVHIDNYRAYFMTSVPVGVADKGDGTYIVAIGAREPGTEVRIG